MTLAAGFIICLIAMGLAEGLDWLLGPEVGKGAAAIALLMTAAGFGYGGVKALTLVWRALTCQFDRYVPKSQRLAVLSSLPLLSIYLIPLGIALLCLWALL